MFPEEFAKGYMLYKQGKLVDTEDTSRPFGTSLTISGWYLLDPEMTVKFNFKNSDIPVFVSAENQFKASYADSRIQSYIKTFQFICNNSDTVYKEKTIEYLFKVWYN
jgi:hypothetical protein